MEQRPQKPKTLPKPPGHIGRIVKLRRSCTRIFYTWWAWEVGAAIVSVAASIALIVLLKEADQQQQHSWEIGSTELTLNTVVAVLSTVIRAALLVMVEGCLSQGSWNWFARKREDHEQRAGRPLKDLDLFAEAGGNSWASLKLLYRTKFRYLVSLGALLVILSLAFDAFAQQVLSSEIRIIATPWYDGGNGSQPDPGSIIPRAVSYRNVIDPNVQGSGHDFTSHNAPNPPLDAQAAIISGLLGTNRASLSASCPSSNCTYPMTPSVGFCSVCEDLKNQVLTVKDPFSNYSYIYTLPIDGNIANNISSSLDPDNLFVFEALRPNGTEDTPVSGRQNITNIWAVGVLVDKFWQGIFGVGELDQAKAEDLIVAYRCSIHFCMQSYNATFRNGTFVSNVQESWDQMNVSVPHNWTSGDYTLGTPQPNWTFVDIPESLNADDSFAQPALDFVSKYSLTAYLSSAISGTVGYDGVSNTTTYHIGGSGSTDTTSKLDASSVQAIYQDSVNAGNMSAKLEDIAAGLNYFVHSSLVADGDARYAPTAYSDAVFVVVRWPWLTYPLALLLAGYVFFAATLLQTWRRAVRPWKSQRLPLLLADVDDAVREAAEGGLHSRKGLKERVGRMEVRMDFDGRDGVAFRCVETKAHPGPKQPATEKSGSESRLL